MADSRSAMVNTLNQQDKEGNTELHHAVKRNNFPKVMSLIANGARVDIKNAAGQTALDIAIEQRYCLIEEAIKEANKSAQSSVSSAPTKRPSPPPAGANSQPRHNRTGDVHINLSRQATIIDNRQVNATAGQSGQYYGAPSFEQPPFAPAQGNIYMKNIAAGNLSINCSNTVTVNGVRMTRSTQPTRSGYPGMFQPPRDHSAGSRIDLKGAKIGGSVTLVQDGENSTSLMASKPKNTINLTGAQIEGDLTMKKPSGTRVDLTDAKVAGSVHVVQGGNEATNTKSAISSSASNFRTPQDTTMTAAATKTNTSSAAKAGEVVRRSLGK